MVTRPTLLEVYTQTEIIRESGDNTEVNLALHIFNIIIGWTITICTNILLG